jgi:hypothetical protein
MEELYCIYSDKVLPENETNPDHIIPLALGGCNGFTIPASISENSRLGRDIDGTLANDPPISMIRSKLGVAGQGSAPDKMIWKKSYLEGDPDRPVQVSFPKDLTLPVEIWDAKARRLLTPDESQGVKFTTSLRFQRFSRIRFVAKVALGAGYFLYGDTFRSFADHGTLRRVMNLDPKDSMADWKSVEVQVYDPFVPIVEEDKGLTGVFRLLAKRLGSSVSFMVCTENIIASVGIFGEWLGAINFKASTDRLPISEGEDRGGQVVGILNRKLCQRSFHDSVADIAKDMGTVP